jgi:Tol biopolymer transport system component
MQVTSSRVRVRWGLVFTIGILAVSGSGASASGAPGTASEATRVEQVAFIRDRRLYLMDADGANQRRVRGFVVQGFSSWSPDGRKLAFASAGEKSRIWIADANGTRPRSATPTGFHDCLWFVWSPNSKRLAYTQNSGCEGDLYVRVVEATGGRPRLVSRGFRSLDPAWAPTGRTIVYTSSPTNRERLYLHLRNPDRGPSRRIPHTRPVISNSGTPSRPTAVWARDGRSIFFLGTNVRRGVSLLRVAFDNRAPRDLTPGLADVKSFDLSRDGRGVVLGVVEAGSGHIYVMNADGTGRRRLTEPGVIHGTDPRWSPDGRKIIFVGRGRGVRNTDIYVMNADGSDKRNLTRSASSEEAPAWWAIR